MKPRKLVEMSKLCSTVYEGRVFHQRLRPTKHRLSYKVFSLLLDLDELPDLHYRLKLFSYNQFNLFSFWDKDFGSGIEEPLVQYVRKILCKFGYNLSNGSIKLLCYPRIFGYVFNPLSVYYCYDSSNILRVIICEVSNTFNERHSYFIKVGHKEGQNKVFSCKKKFYVSPFMDMESTYHFHISPPSDRLTVFIDQHDDKGPLLKASFSGFSEDLSDKTLFYLLLKYPLMTVKVIGGIHWEAIRLWNKGLKIFSRPVPPQEPITLVNKHLTKTKK
tara:strand:- start:7202 stop:8023 length:822 start_codon:yes stop_codon:yes gene_type:complete